MVPFAPQRRSRGRLSRRTFLRAITLASVASGATWLASCGGERERQTATGPIVEMTDQSVFVPASVTIKVGETVTWRSKSVLIHSVTTDPKRVQKVTNVQSPPGVAPFDSGTIASGKSWSHRFDVAGEYRYCCVPHEILGMVGTLVVEP